MNDEPWAPSSAIREHARLQGKRAVDIDDVLWYLDEAAKGLHKTFKHIAAFHKQVRAAFQGRRTRKG